MAEGKAQLEIQYCVSWGYFWQAASLAAQICAGRNREVGVTLTPVGQGRFEIYLNGEQLYNRKEPPADVKDAIGDVRGAVSVAEMVRTRLLSTLEAAAAASPQAGSGAR